MAVGRGIGELWHQPRPEAVHLAIVGREEETDHLLQQLAECRGPGVARGTLLVAYWLASPGYHAQFATRDDVPGFQQVRWDALEALADALLHRTDLLDGIGFDPRSFGGVDWTTQYAKHPQRRLSPPVLLTAVPGQSWAHRGGFIDRLTWHPDAAERDAIERQVVAGWERSAATWCNPCAQTW